MAWVTAQDVLASWIGDEKPSDVAALDAWIGRAERLVRSVVPDVQTRLDAEAALEPPVTVLLESVQDVVVSMVERKFRNPEGVRTRQESTGPFIGSVTLGGDQPGELWLTDDEKRRLGAGGSGSGRAFSVDMIPTHSAYSAASFNPAWWPW